MEKDKAAGIHVAGEEQEDDTPDAAQVSLHRRSLRRGSTFFWILTAFAQGQTDVAIRGKHLFQTIYVNLHLFADDSFIF